MMISVWYILWAVTGADQTDRWDILSVAINSTYPTYYLGNEVNTLAIFLAQKKKYFHFQRLMNIESLTSGKWWGDPGKFERRMAGQLGAGQPDGTKLSPSIFIPFYFHLSSSYCYFIFSYLVLWFHSGLLSYWDILGYCVDFNILGHSHKIRSRINQCNDWLKDSFFSFQT